MKRIEIEGRQRGRRRLRTTFLAAAITACGIAMPDASKATPSTTYWSPATTYIQPFGVLHITYDTYFRENALYPIDTGLEVGILPFDKLQMEVGFDFFMPINKSAGDPYDFPIVFNAKVGAPDNAYFDGSPAWSFGFFGLGLEHDVTDQNALHFEISRTFESFGTPTIGLYYGTNEDLFKSHTGDTEPLGFMAAYTSPNIDTKDVIPGLDHLNLTWDIQSGRNALGATGAGIVAYFTPAIDLITGPVWFFDNDVQPGADPWMWTVQVDIDIDVFSKLKGEAPAAE